MSEEYDFEGVNCSGIIDYQCGDDVCQLVVYFPCGMRFDVHVPGRTAGTTQLPFRYQVLKERAALATCCYWRELIASGTNVEGDPTEDTDYNYEEDTIPKIFSFDVYDMANSGTFFTEEGYDADTFQHKTVQDPDPVYVGGWQHEDTPSFLIKPRDIATYPLDTAVIPTRCTKGEAAIWHQGEDGRPPCNGAKSSCPHYTGPKFQYIRDEDMEPGKIITGEVVQELRSLIKDWSIYPYAQTEWESTFALPYIWARDFSAIPTIIEEDIPEEVEEAPPTTLLTMIYWDAHSSVAYHADIPSEPEGTQLNSSYNSPPDFPTIVDDLKNTFGANLKITFPPLKIDTTSEGQGPISGTPSFTYSTFNNIDHKMYLAGISRPGATVFVVNRSILTSFPNLTSGTTTTNASITAYINQSLMQTFTNGEYKGFSTTYCNQESFWDFKAGIDLNPNVEPTSGNVDDLTEAGSDNENEIFVLSLINNTWTYIQFIVKYKFYNCDFIQAGFNARWPLPDTKDLTTRLGSLSALSPVQFKLLPFTTNTPVVSYAYHFLTFDKSQQRFLNAQEYDDTPDLRFWGILEEVVEAVEGTHLTTLEEAPVGLRWSKFDNCNKFAIEVFHPRLNESAPAGIDRSWEPDKITIQAQAEGGTSEIELKLVTTSGGWKGRSYEGKLFPSRFIIVEPKEDIDVITPAPDTKFKITNLKLYAATDGEEVGLEEDKFDELIDKFPDTNISWNMAGNPMAPAVSGMEGLPSPHYKYPLPKGLGLGVDDVAKHSMSYMVEVSENKDSKNILGRKWVLGLGEMVDFWIRDIDIKYAWSSNQSFKKLLPDYASAIKDLVTEYYYPSEMINDIWTDGLHKQKHVTYRPQCGDHDSITGKGALYHPYDSCFLALVDIYDLGIRILYNPQAEGKEHVDEKYRGPQQQTVKTYKHNVMGTLSSCVWEFSIGTFTRTGVDFSGYGRFRGPISTFFNDFVYGLYKNFGWRFPQFGNRGRRAMRVFRTAHYGQYMYVAHNGTPRLAAGWLPIIPHATPPSIFTHGQSRTFIDYSVGDPGTIQQNLDIEYDTFEGQKELIELGEVANSEGVPEVPLPQFPNRDDFLFKRYTYNDLLEIRRVRRFDGFGVRWPKKGYYNTFKHPQVTWVFPEPEIEIARHPVSLNATSPANVENVFLGVYIRKPQSPVYPDIYKDRYDRPIHLALEEKVHKLRIKDNTYSTTGEIIEYAHLYLEGSSYKLYFDRFTGEIFDNDPITGNPMLHTAQSLEELETYITNNDVQELAFEPVYDFVFAQEEDTVPENLEDMEDFVNKGNLYPDLSTLYIFLDLPLEGPLDPNIPSFKWISFFKSIQVDKIAPHFLPVKEQCIAEGPYYEGIRPKVIFSSYPTIDPTERHVRSNIELDPITGGVIDCDVPFSATLLEWRYYDTEDIETGPPEVGEVDQRKGYVGPIDITFKFPVVIDLRSIYFNYKVEGPHSISAQGPAALPPEIDPTIQLILENTESGYEVEIFNKPSVDLSEYNQATYEGQVGVDLTELYANYFDVIKIVVGARTEHTGFTTSAIILNGNVLRDVKEEFTVLESKFSPSIGYYNQFYKDAGLLYPAMDGEYISGIATPKDVSDPLETVGVCEFWQPGLADLYEHAHMMSIGKTRRHYAGRFDTWDVEKAAGSQGTGNTLDSGAPLSTSQAADLEGFQETEHQETLFALDHSPYNMVPYNSMGLFLTPYNRNELRKLKSLEYVNSLQKIGISATVSRITIDPEGYVEQNLGPVSRGEADEGWQQRGFYACLPNCCRTVGCTGLGVIGLKHAHSVYKKRLQQVCNGISGVKNDQFDLFELPRDVNRPGIVGGGVGAGLVGLSPYDSLAVYLSENFRSSISGRDYRVEKFKEYLEENDFFQS